jgi:RecG-like helicase
MPTLPNGNGSSTGPAALSGTVPIIDARWRRRVTVGGRVRSVRVAPLHDSPTLEMVIVDATGAISLVFLGRREIAGIGVGTVMTAEGVVGIHQARLAILNPTYRLMD